MARVKNTSTGNPKPSFFFRSYFSDADIIEEKELLVNGPGFSCSPMITSPLERRKKKPHTNALNSASGCPYFP